jgi:dTDP-4-amino-4,6-dideoxygalactose transaminase
VDLLHGFREMVTGKSPERLEREIKEYFGKEHVFLVSSGKAALFLILSGLKGLTGKKKVIIPAYTCFSVPSSVRMAGLEIVLCDIRPDTLDYDFFQLRNLVDDDTLCILSIHLFGIPSDVAKIRSLIGNRKIFIVEDAAQAMGGTHDDQKLGTLGDVGFFSLGRGKNIACGSGGVVITSSGVIANSIRKDYSNLETVPTIEYLKMIVQNILIAIFTHPAWYWFPKNFPFLKIGETHFYSTFPLKKLSGFQAGLLHHWRRKLEMFHRNRSRNATYYIEAFHLSGRMRIYDNGIHYNRFPIYVENKKIKDGICKIGNVFGISPMYPSPIHEINEIKDNFRNMNFEYSEIISDTLVTLPTHSLLNKKDLENILEIVHEYIEHEPKDEQAMQRRVECL